MTRRSLAVAALVVLVIATCTDVRAAAPGACTTPTTETRP